MYLMKLVACEILIPVLSDVTRQPWPADKVRAWRDDLAAKFGGFTIRGVVAGVWTDENGVQVADGSVCYLVAVEKARLPELRAFAREAARVFEQRCIYFQIVGAAELLYPDEE